MNRQEPAQPSRDQVVGPSTSEHPTEHVQMRWYEHGQGQEQGEWRQARGQASKGNAVASSIAKTTAAVTTSAAALTMTAAATAGIAGAGAGAEMAAAEEEWEYQQLHG